MNSFFIIAHAPLASALREAALHVFPEASDYIIAFDVMPSDIPENAVILAQLKINQLLKPTNPKKPATVLIFTDIFGATPSNIAAQLADGVHTKLVAGVNVPMLLRAISYRLESLDAVLSRAITGGIQGVMSVAITPQQHQKLHSHDQSQYNHQQ
ncbi:MAG TPA: PTS fructose transporter subunit IIA [Burkholderiaceae bacterium]|nr:PTS fructose transporter subunit IIA [Burkholderiaceae bacterium]